MAERRKYDGRSRRTAHRFLPQGPDGELEPRLLLTTGLHPALSHSQVQVARHTVHAAHPQRITPTAEINSEYASFVSDFAQVEAAYTASLNSQSTGSANVSATVTADYTAGSVQIQVDNASVFGPNGTFTSTGERDGKRGGRHRRDVRDHGALRESASGQHGAIQPDQSEYRHGPLGQRPHHRGEQRGNDLPQLTSTLAHRKWRSTWSFTSTTSRSSFPPSMLHPTRRPSEEPSSRSSISRSPAVAPRAS